MLLTLSPPANPQEERFTDATWAFHEGIARIETFRVLATGSLAAGTSRLIELTDARISNWQPLVPLASEVLKPGSMRDLYLARLKESSQAHTRNVVQETSIILAHTYFDELVSEYCAVAAAASPQAMQAKLRDRKVTLGEAVVASADALLAQVLANHLKDLQRESIRKRFGLFFELAPIDDIVYPEARTYPETYRFNLARIEAFDSLRQDIVHCRRSPEFPEPLEELLAFVQQTVQFLSEVIHQKFQLCISLRKQVLATRIGMGA